MPAANSSVTTQLIVVEVYALLTGALAFAFRPVQKEPLGVRFSSVRDLGLAFAAWLGIVAISAVVYLLLKPIAGGLTDSLRKILSVATDVNRLEDQPLAAWAIAIPRGCLLVPLFEELFFRGALLHWLRGYFVRSPRNNCVGSPVCRNAWISNCHALRLYIWCVYGVDSNSNRLYSQYHLYARYEQRLFSLSGFLAAAMSTFLAGIV